MRTGSWGTPELGITEKLQSWLAPNAAYAASGGSNLIGSTSAQVQTPADNFGSKPGVSYRTPEEESQLQLYNLQNQLNSRKVTNGQVLGAGTGNGVDTGSIDRGVASGNDQIERDYQNYLYQLGSAESGLQGQAAAATSAVDTNYAPVKTALQEKQATSLQGIEAQRQTAAGQEKSAMQQARDLFRQTQQQNIAQLSGLGLSSSSVAEALAERLGVETARRISSVSQSANDIYQNLSKEKATIEEFTKQKLVDMEGTIAQEKQNIQTQLMNGLNQINAARQIAANDKAQRRADLLKSAQDAIGTLQANAQQFAQTLQMWQAQNTSKIDSVINDPQLAQILTAQAEVLNQNPQFSQFGFAPELSYGPSGMTGKIVASKKTYQNGDLDPSGKNYYQDGQWLPL